MLISEHSKFCRQKYRQVVGQSDDSDGKSTCHSVHACIYRYAKADSEVATQKPLETKKKTTTHGYEGKSVLMSNVTDFDVLGSVPVHLQAVEPAPQLWLRPLCSKTMRKVAHKRFAIFGQIPGLYALT